MLGDFDGRLITGATGRDLGVGAKVNAAAQERAGGDDHSARRVVAPVARLDAPHTVSVHEQPGDHPLRQVQRRELLEQLAHRPAVEGAVALRARRPHGGTLGAVEHTELDRRAIGGAAHDAAQGVHLAHDGALGDPADRGIAGHLADGVEVGGEKQSPGVQASGHDRGLRASMASANHDDVVVECHAAIIPAQTPRRRGRRRPARRTDAADAAGENSRRKAEKRYSSRRIGAVPWAAFSTFPAMPLHQKLKAWQHAQRLAVECVKAARGLPDYEQEVLGDQLRRACYSVPLNIAEGSTRRGTREYRRYLDTAWSSLAEVQTALEIARDVGYLDPAGFGRLEALAIETSKTLYGLLRKISDAASRDSKPR